MNGFNTAICCPYCGAKFEDVGVGVGSIIRQRITSEGRYEELEVGQTQGFFCIECGAELPSEIASPVVLSFEEVESRRIELKDALAK